MPSPEIEEEIAQYEERYAQALTKHANVHELSAIWQRIKELKEELKRRQG